MRSTESPAITVVRGADARHVTTVPTADELVFRFSDTPPVPWVLARRLIAAMRGVVGDRAVAAALAPHRALLSLVLRGLESQLTAVERHTRDDHSALRLGRLPTIKLDASDLRVAWAEALATLFYGQRIVVVVPDVDHLDFQSLSLIRPLLGRAGRSLRLVLGDHQTGATEDAGAAAPDAGERNIFERLRASHRHQELRRLEQLPCCRVFEAGTETGASAVSPPRALDVRDVLDDGLEERAWAVLDTAPENVIDSDDVRSALDAAFASYGFDTALRLASFLLSRETDPRARQRLHWRAALSCYNLLTSRDDWPAAGRMLTEHLRAVLENERDAAAQTLARYLLSIVSSRMTGDLDAGLRHGEAAVRTACEGGLEPGLRHFLEAWARNVHAYSLFRHRRLEAAVAQCKQAAELLADAPAHPAVPDVLVLTTRWHLFDNLAKAAGAAGDSERAIDWQRQRNALAGRLPTRHRPTLTWLLPDVRNPDLRSETVALEAQLRRATANLALPLEAFAAHALALFHIRLGEAAQAHELFARALHLWQAIDADPENRLTGELNCAVSAFRAEAFDDAGRRFEVLLANPAFAGTEAEAELMAASAMVAAAVGDRDTAGRLAGRSRQLAAERGANDVNVRVLRSLAEVALLLADDESAHRMLAAAKELIAEDHTDLPAEDLLGVLAAELACGLGDRDTVEQAIRLVPTALEDTNAWWDLSRLLPAALALVESGDLTPDDEEIGPGLRSLAVAATQRADCQPAAGRLADRIALADV